MYSYSLEEEAANIIIGYNTLYNMYINNIYNETINQLPDVNVIPNYKKKHLKYFLKIYVKHFYTLLIKSPIFFTSGSPTIPFPILRCIWKTIIMLLSMCRYLN